MRALSLLFLLSLSSPTFAAGGPEAGAAASEGEDAVDRETAVEAVERLTARDVKEGGDALAAEVRALARRLHLAFVRERDRAAAPLAERAYLAWLRHFGERTNAGEVHADLGELRYKLRRYADALDSYEAAVAAPGMPVAKARDAARNAVWAGAELARKDPGPRGERGSSGPVELSEGEQRSLAAHDAFVARFPEDPDAGQVAYGAASLLCEHGRFDEAVERLEAVVASTGGEGKAGEAAARLLEDAKARAGSGR